MKEVNQVSGRKVRFFFLLTFIYSWLLWLPFVLSGLGFIQLSASVLVLTTPAVMLGAFGPLISAVILIARNEGFSGVKDFFRNAFTLRVKPIYYIWALLLPLITTVVAHYIVNLTGIDMLPPNLFPEDLPVHVMVLIIPYFIFILIAGGGQEEFGLRGYAQEPLQNRFGILSGSILLGTVWGVWHLPLWFIPGEGHAYYSFFAFLIYTMSMSVILGWLFNASDKKLIIPLITHTTSNVAVPFFPILHMADVPQPGYWVWVWMHVFVAAGISIWFMKIKPITQYGNTFMENKKN